MRTVRVVAWLLKLHSSVVSSIAFAMKGCKCKEKTLVFVIVVVEKQEMTTGDVLSTFLSEPFIEFSAQFKPTKPTLSVIKLESLSFESNVWIWVKSKK